MNFYVTFDFVSMHKNVLAINRKETVFKLKEMQTTHAINRSSLIIIVPIIIKYERSLTSSKMFCCAHFNLTIFKKLDKLILICQSLNTLIVCNHHVVYE